MSYNKEKQVGGRHYKHMVMEPAEYCAINNIPFIEGNIIKYVCRHSQKNGVEDLKKAMHYIEMLMQIKYPEELPKVEVNYTQINQNHD